MDELRQPTRVPSRVLGFAHASASRSMENRCPAGTTRPWTSLLIRDGLPSRRHQICPVSTVGPLRKCSIACRREKTWLMRHDLLPRSFASSRASTTSSAPIASSVCGASSRPALALCGKCSAPTDEAASSR